MSLQKFKQILNALQTFEEINKIITSGLNPERYKDVELFCLTVHGRGIYDGNKLFNEFKQHFEEFWISGSYNPGFLFKVQEIQGWLLALRGFETVDEIFNFRNFLSDRKRKLPSLERLLGEIIPASFFLAKENDLPPSPLFLSSFPLSADSLFWSHIFGGLNRISLPALPFPKKFFLPFGIHFVLRGEKEFLIFSQSSNLILRTSTTADLEFVKRPFTPLEHSRLELEEWQTFPGDSPPLETISLLRIHNLIYSELSPRPFVFPSVDEAKQTFSSLASKTTRFFAELFPFDSDKSEEELDNFLGWRDGLLNRLSHSSPWTLLL